MRNENNDNDGTNANADVQWQGCACIQHSSSKSVMETKMSKRPTQKSQREEKKREREKKKMDNDKSSFTIRVCPHTVCNKEMGVVARTLILPLLTNAIARVCVWYLLPRCCNIYRRVSEVSCNVLTTTRKNQKHTHTRQGNMCEREPNNRGI